MTRKGRGQVNRPVDADHEIDFDAERFDAVLFTRTCCLIWSF
ncbi:MAG: hypothetical protein RIS85_495 [Pseudomonadota bacterium]